MIILYDTNFFNKNINITHQKTNNNWTIYKKLETMCKLLNYL